ncbi:MAG: tryptophan synthase subunit alpha [Campylobacterota bacterium]|nr:tryptophan synthase subunit alpha [Campylobacterota bacterium]
MKHLVAYITTGYPDLNFTTDLALALGENGVDSIELGVAFSDPVADGPIIEKANFHALERGFKFQDLLSVSEKIAKEVDTLWMGYFNPFYQRDMSTLLATAKSLHVSGMIIPDLPHEEALLYHNDFMKNDIANISFVAPTDSDERIKKVVLNAKKFIYLVAYTGITGAGKSEDLSGVIHSIRNHSDTSVYVGFGVNEKTAKEKAKGVDGVIVGSAFVNILLQDNLTFTQKINNCSELSRIIKSKINE